MSEADAEFQNWWENLSAEDQIRYFAKTGSFPFVQTAFRDEELNFNIDEWKGLLSQSYRVAAERLERDNTPEFARFAKEKADFRDRWLSRSELASRASNREELMNLVLTWFT